MSSAREFQAFQSPPAHPRRLLVHEVAAMTGVNAERLRTWERRHGFPKPKRLPSGTRTYATGDLWMIVTAARLVEAGHQVGEAIAAARRGRPDATDLASYAPTLERAPMPAIAFADTEGGNLTAVWANMATQLHVGPLDGPRDTAAVSADHLGAGARDVIRAILRGSASAPPQLVQHVDWVGPFPLQCSSLVWRADGAHGPLVILLQVPHTPCSGLDETTVQDPLRWTDGVAAARHILQRESGLVSAQQALRQLTEHVRALDGLLVVRRPCDLRTASSVRGMVSARVIDPARCPELWQSDQPSSKIRWLEPEAAGEFGLPGYVRFLAIPLAIGGQGVGDLILAFVRKVPISEVVGELLHGLAVAVAAAVQRDRVAGGAEAASLHSENRRRATESV